MIVITSRAVTAVTITMALANNFAPEKDRASPRKTAPSLLLRTDIERSGT